MDDLSAKESRQLLALSRNVVAEPWPLPGPKASGEELDGEALRASLKILAESSQPMVTSTPFLLEGTTSVPVSQLPFFSVDMPRSRSSHIPLVSALTASLRSASMCFSDSICVTPLPVECSVSLLASSSVCISEIAQVCAPVSLPVSVPYVPSLFVSQSVPDLSVSKFSEFHIRDVNQFVGQQGALASGSGLSIPVSVSAPSVSVCGVSIAGTESVSISAAHSSKGKSPVISTSKRKIDDSDEVVFVSETRGKKKYAPSVSVRMTRSKTGSVLPKSEPPKTSPKLAPASSKKSKTKTFQPNIGPYSPWLIPEFYTNLQEDADDPNSAHFHEIFIRNKWYSISPASINKYLQRSSNDFAVTMSSNSLAGFLTHNQIVEWPSTGLRSQNLTAVYSVLLRLAATNWLPSVNANIVYEKMGVLLYKVRNKLDVDLGSINFSHIMTFTKKKKEAKIYLSYPSLIYGLLSSQGFKPYDYEPILDNDQVYRVDPRLAQGNHFDDRVSLTASASAPGS
nr:uncharacterized protein LOC109191099 [Ipomoea batatas]